MQNIKQIITIWMAFQPAFLAVIWFSDLYNAKRGRQLKNSGFTSLDTRYSQFIIMAFFWPICVKEILKMEWE